MDKAFSKRRNLFRQIKWRKLIRPLLVVTLLLALAGAVYAAVLDYTTPHYALLPGGVSAGGGFTLQNVSGEAVTGVSSGGGYQLCAGFLCGTPRYVLFLPMLKR